MPGWSANGTGVSARSVAGDRLGRGAYGSHVGAERRHDLEARRDDHGVALLAKERIDVRGRPPKVNANLVRSVAGYTAPKLRHSQRALHLALRGGERRRRTEERAHEGPRGQHRAAPRLKQQEARRWQRPAECARLEDRRTWAWLGWPLGCVLRQGHSNEKTCSNTD